MSCCEIPEGAPCDMVSAIREALMESSPELNETNTSFTIQENPKAPYAVILDTGENSTRRIGGADEGRRLFTLRFYGCNRASVREMRRAARDKLRRYCGVTQDGWFCNGSFSLGPTIKETNAVFMAEATVAYTVWYR